MALGITLLGLSFSMILLLSCGPPYPFTPKPYTGPTLYDYRGEKVARFPQCGDLISFPKWSPDGKRILYRQRRREKRGLWIIDLEEEEKTPRQIFSPSEGSVIFPHWSPDGQQILFTYSYGRGENRRRDIGIVNSDGSNFRILVKDAYGGCWMPDGEKIIYARGMNSEIKRVFLYDIKTKEEKCLTPSGYKVLMICEVSPQGDKLLFAHDTEKKIPGLHFHIMDISTGEEYWLCAGQYASWSPDGKKIVYTSAFPQQTLSVVNIDGTPSTILEEKVPEVIEYLHLCYEPDWSPDGKKIAFAAGEYIGHHVFRPSSELFILYLW